MIDRLEELAKRQQDGMVGPTSMIVSTADILRLVRVARAAQTMLDEYDAGLPRDNASELVESIRAALAELENAK
jgi:uncharacterized protein YmfQ (DUF2313 family)